MVIRWLSLCLLGVFLTLVSAPVQAQFNTPQPHLNDAAQMNNTMKPDAIFRQHSYGGKIHDCLHKAPTGTGLTDEQWQAKYSARFNYCMRDILGDASVTVLQAIQNYMDVALYAIIFLATVVMGVKAIGGMFRNVKVEAVLFVSKVVGAIIAFRFMPDISALFFDITDWILTLLASGASKTFEADPNSPFFCKTAATSTSYGMYQWVGVFDWMDCLFRKIWGMGTSSEMRTGFITIVGAAFFTGVGGIQLAMMFFAFFIGLGLFLLRATTMLLMAYGAIAMLMMMMPIFILTIFFKATESYFFQRWLSMVVRNIVQPAIVIGFMYFALAALDVLIYKGSEEVYYKYSAAPVSADSGLAQRINSVAGVDEHVQLAQKDLGTGNLTSGGASVNPADYEIVVPPIHKVFEIDPGGTIDEQFKQINLLIKTEKILQDFEIQADNAFFDYIDNQCGKFGIGSAISGAIGDWARSNWGQVRATLNKISADPNETEQALQDGMNAPVGSPERTRAERILCGVGKVSRWAMSFGFVRERVQASVRSMMPEVPQLQLGVLADISAGENPQEVHERKIRQAIFAVTAILILAGTLFTYTGHIERLAASVTGRMGFGLSITSPSEGGGGSLGKTIKAGMSRAEDGWTAAHRNKGSLLDRAGGGAIKGLFGMTGSR